MPETMSELPEYLKKELTDATVTLYEVLPKGLPVRFISVSDVRELGQRVSIETDERRLDIDGVRYRILGDYVSDHSLGWVYVEPEKLLEWRSKQPAYKQSSQPQQPPINLINEKTNSCLILCNGNASGVEQYFIQKQNTKHI